MTNVTSNRSFVRFYLALFFIILFYFLMGLATLGLFISLYHSNNFETRNYGLIPLFILIVIAAVYTIARYVISAPSIRVNKECIVFNSSIYFWKDLEQIELTGKRTFLFSTDAEGVMIKFKFQKERLFLDNMYSNSAEIKMFIQQVVLNKGPFEKLPTLRMDSNNISSETFLYYKGNQFFCFEGIMLWVFNLFFIYGAILNVISSKVGLATFICVLAIGSFFLLSRRMYYFGISDNYLIIRNHDEFWIEKSYMLADIKEVVLESAFRMPTGLRVITNGFESKLYFAASLWNKHWRSLKEDLERKNIKVRVETYIGQN